LPGTGIAMVTGGPPQLSSATGMGQYELLGESIDDAAGEAFDKTAKLLGLDYPGGPLLSKMAAQGTAGLRSSRCTVAQSGRECFFILTWV
ncbi:hypothetical protein O5853_30090, partial [Escherichia coli]|nr:hypothetical protein [Escherichia coli]